MPTNFLRYFSPKLVSSYWAGAGEKEVAAWAASQICKKVSTSGCLARHKQPHHRSEKKSTPELGREATFSCMSFPHPPQKKFTLCQQQTKSVYEV
jgi:hypothetical protein